VGDVLQFIEFQFVEIPRQQSIHVVSSGVERRLQPSIRLKSKRDEVLQGKRAAVLVHGEDCFSSVSSYDYA
jgi:hypothetical protein